MMDKNQEQRIMNELGRLNRTFQELVSVGKDILEIAKEFKAKMKEDEERRISPHMRKDGGR